MKSDTRFLTGTLCIALVFVCAVMSAGCTTSPDSPASPTQPATPAPVPTYQTPAVTATSQPALITTTLSNGVTISYPRDWRKEVTSETSMRDYGRITTNIANFYSPEISGDRILPSYRNIDISKYTTLSVDVDPSPVKDFENYFNLATLALQEKYGKVEITKHNYQLKISSTSTFEGYRSYQMDFDTYIMRGSYIFTNVDGTVYIFSFRNPSPYSVEVMDMYKSIRIVPPGS
jgi:hypothetical protein